MTGLTAFCGGLRRIDHDIIISIVENGSKVLDVGCGEGDLLARLVEERNVHARGLEIDTASVNHAVSRGLSVVQGNAEDDLGDYPDNAFEYVVISQTIQAMNKPDQVLRDALRVGRKAIVSFPNFGFLPVRSYLFFRGRMPMTSSLPYRWYNTPNIHFCTIADFHSMCDNLGTRVEHSSYLAPAGRSIKSKRWANLLADQAVLVLARDSAESPA